MTPTKLAFEDRYCDDSGVEFAVRYDATNVEDEIEFYRIESVKFPIARLPWLLAALQRIQSEITTSSQPSAFPHPGPVTADDMNEPFGPVDGSGDWSRTTAQQSEVK